MAEAGTLPFEMIAIQFAARTAILMKGRNNANLRLIQNASDRLVKFTGSVLLGVNHILRKSDRVEHVASRKILVFFSEEAYAINIAVSIPNVNQDMIILTDSASCLVTLEAET